MSGAECINRLATTRPDQNMAKCFSDTCVNCTSKSHRDLFFQACNNIVISFT